MAKNTEKNLSYIDKYLIGVLACLILAVALIISVWWYYDNQISRMEQDINRTPGTTITEQ